MLVKMIKLFISLLNLVQWIKVMYLSSCCISVHLKKTRPHVHPEIDVVFVMAIVVCLKVNGATNFMSRVCHQLMSGGCMCIL